MPLPNYFPQQASVTDDTEVYHQTDVGNSKTTALQWKEYLQADGAGDTNYVHQQSNPSLSWSISHNLGKFPNLMVKEPDGSIVEGDVTHSSNNLLIITFSSPTAGTAYLS